MMLAEVMRAWRWHNELTIAEAARKIGISVDDYRRMESGGFKSREVTWFITRWLMGEDHPLYDLFYGPPNPPRHRSTRPGSRTVSDDRRMVLESKGSISR